MTRPALAVILLAVAAGGCTRTRTVTVERPAPPPSVVTVTDTVRVAAPPDTAYVESVRVDTVTTPGEAVTRDVVRTVPRTVTVYRQRRPDSLSAFRLHALTVDSLGLVLLGADRDWRFAPTRDGETLVVEGAGPDSLSAYVVGTPVAPPALRVECPACPECVVPKTLGGRLRLGWWLAVAFAMGGVAGFVATSILRR